MKHNKNGQPIEAATTTTVLTGKAAWDAMTDEQKEQAIQAKKEAIRTGITNIGHKTHEALYSSVGLMNEAYKQPFEWTKTVVTVVEYAPEDTASFIKAGFKAWQEKRAERNASKGTVVNA